MEKEEYSFDFSRAEERDGWLEAESEGTRPCDCGLGHTVGPEGPCALAAKKGERGRWIARFWFPDSDAERPEAEGRGENLPAAFDDMAKNLDCPWIRLNLGWSD